MYERPIYEPLAEMTGTDSQIQWAVQIRPRVDAEFQRVAAAFRTIGLLQSPADRTDTDSILAILEELRAEVLAHTHAGYYIRDWQELNDQVRMMIFRDPRYQAIKAVKAARD